MGMNLQFHEGRGPVFERPLEREADINSLKDVDAASHLNYVLDAISLVKKELAGRVPVIGFAGAPWTLAAYMVEGQGSKNFIRIKELMYSRPGLLQVLLGKLSDAVAGFLSAQVAAGADVVQIFDSWAGILSPEDFKKFSMPYLKQVVQKISGLNVPVIVFARNAGHAFDELAQMGAQVLGVSWTEDLQTARRQVGNAVALQGNLDPCALFAPVDVIRKEVRSILQKAGPTGHIFNLGHGILPQTPVEHARAMVEIVKEESAKLMA
jgi:uroporphyrinogen decarboxylase